MIKKHITSSKKSLAEKKIMIKFRYNGCEYNYIGVCKHRDSQGAGLDTVVYERDGIMYSRELLDFFDKFERVKLEDLLSNVDLGTFNREGTDVAVRDGIEEDEEGRIYARDEDDDDPNCTHFWEDKGVKMSTDPDITIH